MLPLAQVQQHSNYMYTLYIVYNIYIDSGYIIDVYYAQYALYIVRRTLHISNYTLEIVQYNTIQDAEAAPRMTMMLMLFLLKR